VAQGGIERRAPSAHARVPTRRSRARRGAAAAAMALGSKAEEDLETKRVPIRMTFMGPGEAGKTSLINVLVNNQFQEKYPTTENVELYYTTFECLTEEGSSYKFRTLLEIEDTPPFENMDETMLANLIDPFWPKPEDLAMKNPAKDVVDPSTGKVKKSVNVAFSMTKPPVGRFNDEDADVKKGECALSPHLYFCSRPDWRDRVCGPKKEGKHFQCRSCQRFQSSLQASGEYRPMVRRRMIYFFVYDANDEKSYFKVHEMYRVFREVCEKKRLKQWPLLYFIGNKIDVNPDKDTFKGIQSHVKEWARTEVESGRRISTEMVSASRNKFLKKVITSAVQDVKTREPLWKMNGEGANDSLLSDKGCCVQ